MEKKISKNNQEINNTSMDDRKKRNSSKSMKINQERLPWWVELLFVQIGLPDKWLIKILKTKKRSIDFYKDEKKLIFFIILFIFSIFYLQPIVKYSRTKLRCQKIASEQFYEITDLKKKDLKIINMISVNFCNGGNEIDNYYKEGITNRNKQDLKSLNNI